MSTAQLRIGLILITAIAGEIFGPIPLLCQQPSPQALYEQAGRMLGTQGTSHRVVKYEGQPLPAQVIKEQAPNPATGLILVNKNPASPATKLSPLCFYRRINPCLHAIQTAPT